MSLKSIHALRHARSPWESDNVKDGRAYIRANSVARKHNFVAPATTPGKVFAPIEGLSGPTKPGENSPLSETNEIGPLNNQTETNAGNLFVAISSLIAKDLSRFGNLCHLPGHRIKVGGI